MADSKISALTAVTTPAATDEFAVNQGGTSKKITLAQVDAATAAPMVLVAATNSDAAFQRVADYVCDGTADESEINSAIGDLTAGGEVVLAPGTYTLAAAVSFTSNLRYRLVGYGALINLPAGISGIKVNQGNASGVRGVRIEGLVIDGQSLGTNVGVEFEDTNNAELLRCDIENCTTGVLFDSQAASAFVEGSFLEEVLIRSCTTGWATSVTSGTGSFAQTVARGLKITGCTTGISFPNSSIMQRGHIQATVWIDTGQTAASLDCNVEDLTLDLAVEGANAATGNTGIVIGTNATNTEQMFLKLLFTGTIATQATFNSKNVHYWSGGSQIIQSAGTAVLGYKRHGDATDRVRIEGLTAGGRIQLGNGTLLDVNWYRSAADVGSSDDKFDPASLNLQLKAGTPIDGDVVGGAANGDVIWDSTNGILYVRHGGVWTASTATHAAAADPHTGYRLESADHTHASTGLQAGQISHANLTGVTANQHHTQAHAIGGADHTLAGGTTGQFLRATGATSFAFQSINLARGGTNYNSAGLSTAVNIIVWRAPFACTVTNVRGYRVGGTGATVNARRNGTSNHLAAALSLTSADTWQDGGAVQNTAYAAGDKLEIMFVSYAGSPTQVAIQVDFTRP